MKSENTKLVIVFILAVFVSSFINALASGTLFDSSEVVYDNYNTGMNQSTVQGAVDDLYAAATDYSNLSSRVTTLENHWSDYGNLFKISGNVNGNHDIGIQIFDNSGKIRSGFNYNSTADMTVLASYDSTGTWGNFGTLSMFGDVIRMGNDENNAVVKINNYDVSTFTTESKNYNTTNVTKASSAQSQIPYYKIGHVVIVQLSGYMPTNAALGAKSEIVSGFPKAKYTMTGGIPTTDGKVYSVGVSAGDTKIYWWWPGTLGGMGYGQFIYFAE